MDNSKTIVCPNCGAVSTNLDNCEYCGSILVKVAFIFQEEGKDVTKELKEEGIGKSVYVNPSTVESIERNTNRCKRFNTAVECFYPLCYRLGERWLDNISIIFNPKSAPILKIKYNMLNSKDNRYFENFENRRISRLFEIVQEGNSMICSLQLDDDVITTAQIIAHIIKKIFYIDNNHISTSEFVTLNGVKYLIATESKMKECERCLKKEFEDCNYSKRCKERNEIPDIKYFINSYSWKEEFWRRISYVENGCRYWIDENTTEEDIKRIAESNSPQEVPPAVEKVINEIIEEETKKAEDAKNTTVGCLIIIGVIILVIILCTSC